MDALSQVCSESGYSIRFTCGPRLLWCVDTARSLADAIKKAEETLNVYRTTHVGLKATISEHKVVKTLT